MNENSQIRIHLSSSSAIGRVSKQQWMEETAEKIFDETMDKLVNHLTFEQNLVP